MLRWAVTLAGAIGLCVANAGCGSDGDDSPAGPVSCTLALRDESFMNCLEVVGLTVAQADIWRGSCVPSENVTAVYSAGLCSRTNALGGCRQQTSETVTLTQWFYASDSLTAEDLERICIETNQTFVAPQGVG